MAAFVSTNGRFRRSDDAASLVYTGYTVAKVLISLPDELLERLDRHVRERGTTRSGLLRELAERELTRDDAQRGKRIDELLGKARHHGGASVADIRHFRNTR